jgi:hypothetical protein
MVAIVAELMLPVVDFPSIPSAAKTTATITVNAFLPELLVLDLLEFLGKLIEPHLALLLPGGEDEGVFPGRVRLIHPRHAGECAGQRPRSPSKLSARADLVEIVRDFTATLMLREQHLDQLFVRPATLAHLGEDVLLLERAFVVLLAEFAE